VIDRFAFIIGAMSSGTTTAFAALARHPQLCPCRVKEPEFFSDDAAWARGIAWYRGLFDWRDPPHRRGLEASANYSKRHLFPETVERLASLDADCRFVYILRHPVERIEAHLRHRIVKDGDAPLAPDADVPANILRTSLYAWQLRPYRERFGADRVLPVAFETLRDDPAALLARIERFLDLDPAPDLARGATARNPGRADAPLYHALARRPGAVRLARLVPAGLRRRIRRSLSRPLDVDTRLTGARRAAVTAALADDLRELRETWGFDTASWGLD
jgi:hypothetical protein